jgi:beta-glucosidase-like glycosyl hydrolase
LPVVDRATPCVWLFGTVNPLSAPSSWLQGGGGPTYPPVQQGIPAALASGALSRAAVETAVRRLLRVRLRLGMFDAPTARYYDIGDADVASPAHIAIAEEGARAGMTLLRNVVPVGGARPALPLSLAALAGKRLAVIGPNANASYILLGSYSDSGCCTRGGIPTVLAELTARAQAAGVTISYAPGCNNASCLNTDGFAAAAAAAAKPSVLWQLALLQPGA